MARALGAIKADDFVSLNQPLEGDDVKAFLRCDVAERAGRGEGPNVGYRRHDGLTRRRALLLRGPGRHETQEFLDQVGVGHPAARHCAERRRDVSVPGRRFHGGKAG